MAPAENNKNYRHSNGGDQRHQSQYNPYTANPQNGTATTPNETAAEPAETDDYISPSHPLPAVLVMTSEKSSLFTGMVKLSESNEQDGDNTNYVYDQAVPAAGLTSNDQDVPASESIVTGDYYENAADCKAKYEPPYVNGKCTPAVESEDSVRSKAPIPVPRSTGSRGSGPVLDRVPSGLYVEEVNVGDDFNPGKDQYVIPELEEHYSNSNQ